MNAAQRTIAKLSEWLDESSTGRLSPLGRPISVGRYASLCPCLFEAAPIPIFADEALPLYVAGSQAEGVAIAMMQTSAPAGQPHMWERLAHILFRMEDRTLPLCAMVPLIDPGEPIVAAVERAGLAGVDLTAVAVLAVPLWSVPAAQRPDIARRLPLLP